MSKTGMEVQVDNIEKKVDKILAWLNGETGLVAQMAVNKKSLEAHTWALRTLFVAFLGIIGKLLFWT